MSILIKGMDMPKDCWECQMFGTWEEIGKFNCFLGAKVKDIDIRATDCPLVEIDDTDWEWCHDCKEYDQESHCCHRWTKVIRQTVAELEERYGERRADEGTTE